MSGMRDLHRQEPLPASSTDAIYAAGHTARQLSRPIDVCPHGAAEARRERAWWLAGWHDADIEFGGTPTGP